MADDATYRMIARIKSAHDQVAEQLVRDREPSLKMTVDDVFKKVLLLCAASYCESRLTDILVSLYKNECGGGGIMLSEFVKNQALDRKYHQLFNWRAKHANSFFGLLGEGFKSHMRGVIESNPSYEKAEAAFVELGRLRNQAIHENLATFSLEKNAGDILDLYEESQRFLNIFDAEVRRYSSGG